MSNVALISGTRKGIGRELAEHFLSRSFSVAGCSRKDATIEHDNYTHYNLDVSDEKAVVHMVRETARKYGRIDILINNAGAASMNHLTLTPGSTAVKLFGTNSIGTFLLTREASKVMIKNRYGRIVNFTTVAVPFSLEGEAIYVSSKAAVEGLTKVSARELGEFGITVNAIGPTPVETDLIKTVPRDKINGLLERQAIKRFGDFKDVINVIDFFTSRDSGFVTGQIVYLGGVTR